MVLPFLSELGAQPLPGMHGFVLWVTCALAQGMQNQPFSFDSWPLCIGVFVGCNTAAPTLLCFFLSGAVVCAADTFLVPREPFFSFFTKAPNSPTVTQYMGGDQQTQGVNDQHLRVRVAREQK